MRLITLQSPNQFLHSYFSLGKRQNGWRCQRYFRWIFGRLLSSHACPSGLLGKRDWNPNLVLSQGLFIRMLAAAYLFVEAAEKAHDLCLNSEIALM